MKALTVIMFLIALQLMQHHSLHKIIILPVTLDVPLTLTLLTWTIWWAPTNACKWRMGFNSAIKGLIWKPELHVKSI